MSSEGSAKRPICHLRVRRDACNDQTSNQISHALNSREVQGKSMQQRSRCPRRSPTPRGIHHLALCTDDIKTTIDFYVDVLGVPLVHAMRVGEAEALSSLGLVARLVGGVWDAATVGAGASRSFSSQ